MNKKFIKELLKNFICYVISFFLFTLLLIYGINKIDIIITLLTLLGLIIQNAPDGIKNRISQKIDFLTIKIFSTENIQKFILKTPLFLVCYSIISLISYFISYDMTHLKNGWYFALYTLMFCVLVIIIDITCDKNKSKDNETVENNSYESKNSAYFNYYISLFIFFIISLMSNK